MRRPKPNNARIDVSINRSKQVVDIAAVYDGEIVSTVNFSVEQAMNHIKHVQTAIDMLLGRSTGGIILPETMQ